MASLLLAVAAVMLRRPRRTPALRCPLATRATACIAAVCFFWSAPVTLAAVNHATGIPNVGAPLTYGSISALSCSLIILLIHWRGGPQERIRRMTRMAVAVYGTLIVAIVVLFSLADARTGAAHRPGHVLREHPVHAGDDRPVPHGAPGEHHRPERRLPEVGARRGHRAAPPRSPADPGRPAARRPRIHPRQGHRGRRALAGVRPRLPVHHRRPAGRRARRADLLRRIRPAASRVRRRRGAAEPGHLPRAAAAVVGGEDLAATPVAEPAWWQPWWHLPSNRLYLLEANIRDALLQLTAHFDQRVGHAAYAAAVERGEERERARIAAEKAMIIDGLRRAVGPGRRPCRSTGEVPRHHRSGRAGARRAPPR
ncbi:hypothetical protein LT493_02445 [Streptomyces tricolor]|nr:hypothetical protein [Streptomyces tricolor]